MLTQKDLTEINNSIDNVQQNISDINFGSATLIFGTSTTLNISQSKYIVIFLYGYMNNYLSSSRQTYYYYVNNTIIHQLGNSKLYNNVPITYTNGQGDIFCTGWAFNISSSTQTNIIYKFGNINEFDSQYDNPSYYFNMNYICFA